MVPDSPFSKSSVILKSLLISSISCKLCFLLSGVSCLSKIRLGGEGDGERLVSPLSSSSTILELRLDALIGLASSKVDLNFLGLKTLPSLVSRRGLPTSLGLTESLDPLVKVEIPESILDFLPELSFRPELPLDRDLFLSSLSGELLLSSLLGELLLSTLGGELLLSSLLGRLLLSSLDGERLRTSLEYDRRFISRDLDRLFTSRD